MQRILGCVVATLAAIDPSIVFAKCPNFTGSTMEIGGVPPAQWRTDYPSSVGKVSAPWENINFRKEPQKYMSSVIETVRPHFGRSGQKLVGTGKEDWWISLWLDFTTSGREPLMGLTKERGPNPGDLSETHGPGFQVWAVGFYNAPGATILGRTFADPCNPQLPQSVNFPEGTVSENSCSPTPQQTKSSIFKVRRNTSPTSMSWGLVVVSGLWSSVSRGLCVCYKSTFQSKTRMLLILDGSLAPLAGWDLPKGTRSLTT